MTFFVASFLFDSLGCRLCLFLTPCGDVVHNEFHEQNKAAQVDDNRGYKVGYLRAVHALIEIRTADRYMLNKVGREYRADRVQAAEECRGYDVKAHSGNGRLSA